MPSPVLIGSQSVAGQANFLQDIRPGKYEAIFLKLSANAAVGQTLTEAGFGRIDLLERGAPVVSVDYDNLHDINELKRGNLRVRAGAGVEHEFPVVIPRNYWFDDNIHQVNSGDQVQVRIQYGATFTTVFTGADTAAQKVYGIVRETGLMAYNLRMIQWAKVYGAGVFTEPLNTENVLAVYIMQGAAGDLDRVRVTKDKIEMANVAIGTAAVGLVEEDLLEYSDWYNNQEAATDAIATTDTSALAEIDVADSSAIDEFLSDDVDLEFTTSGAANFTQEWVVMSADFTDVKLRQTKAENAAITAAKVSRKQQKGKTRPIRVLEELATR